MSKFQIGQTWRAKKPSNVAGLINDRCIRWVSADGDRIQYDSPAVGFGRRYPTVTAEDFEKWAAREVGAELPEGEWASWDFSDRSKNK